MPSNTIKTVYLDKLTTTNNAVCIKDQEISTINEITTDCTGENEIKLNCPGNNEDYECSIEEDRFKISGLQHSGVKEFYIAPPTENNNPPSNGGGSSGGGGGSSTTTNCIEDWDCTGWLTCRPDGTQTRTCIDKNNCGTQPPNIQECAYESPEEETTPKEETETKQEQGITGITGAVIGLSKTTGGKMVGVVAIILVLGLLWQYGVFSKIKNKSKEPNF